MGWTPRLDYTSPGYLHTYQNVDMSLLTQLPGVFNISVCADAADSFDDFKEIVTEKGISYGSRGNALPGSPIEMKCPG
jgi:hypothetical protein